jgi:hypothetical protein
MPKLLWEVKTLVCDICKENEMRTTIKIKDKWLGVCETCLSKEKGKYNEK